MNVARGLVVLLSAGLAGAAGLGSEALLLSFSGLLVGYGRSGALCLSAWIASWAVGAWLAGRSTMPLRRALALAGAAAALGAVAAAHGMLAASGWRLGEIQSIALATGLVALAALPQGLFLPLLARALPRRDRTPEVGALFGANLLGAVAGARWIGFDLAAAQGRLPAAWTAAGLALLAGVAAAWVARSAGDRAAVTTDLPHGRESQEPGAPSLTLRRAGLVVGLASAWLAGVEWIGLRLGTLWLGGMQPAITAVLSASLLALAAGAWILPPLLPKDGRGPLAALGLAAVGCLWIVLPWSAALTDAWRGHSGLLAMLGLLGPALAPLGALVPLLHRAVRGESGARLGGLLLHEAWGAALGVPIAHFLLVPRFGCGGALALLVLLALPAGCALSPAIPTRAGRGPGVRWLAVPPMLTVLMVLMVLALAFAIGRAVQPALRTPQLANPAFQVLSFQEDAGFAVTVVDDGVRGERTLLTDGFRATALGDDYLYMQVLGHLPVLLHAAPRRVGVLAFGTGTTAGAVSLHQAVERIDVLEISRAVCEAAPYFEEANHGVFAEGVAGLLNAGDGRSRVVLHLGDGRRTLGRLTGVLDVLTMEPLLPDSPFAVYLYTPEFYERALSALAPGGLICQWVPPHALAPDTFDAVLDAFTNSLPWSAVFLFGTQVILVGGTSEPMLAAENFPAPGTEAGKALASLGLESPAGLMARYVTGGDAWPRAPRPLTDADPWIVYRQRRSGPEALRALPLNLRRLRELEADPPLAWRVATGPQAIRRLQGVRLLHRAREAWRVWDLERRGIPFADDPSLGHLEGYRAQLASALPGDPELAQFERQVRFDGWRTGGVSDLARGLDQAALEKLTLAAELRPGRADVHLFVALAAGRLGHVDLAQKAGQRARALCPRLLETPQGQRALELGLPAIAWPARAGAPNP